jgi:hypothetical protein
VDGIAAVAASVVDTNDRETHQVSFMNNEGVLLPQSSITHDYEATVVDWQPNGKVVAIGWGDGTSEACAKQNTPPPLSQIFPPPHLISHRHGIMLDCRWPHSAYVDVFQQFAT